MGGERFAVKKPLLIDAINQQTIGPLRLYIDRKRYEVYVNGRVLNEVCQIWQTLKRKEIANESKMFQ